MYTTLENWERPESGIYFKIFEKNTIFNEHPVSSNTNNEDMAMLDRAAGVAVKWTELSKGVCEDVNGVGKGEVLVEEVG